MQTRVARTLVRTSLAILFGAATAPSLAQPLPYPRQPIRVLVPFTAGGGTDILARIVGQKVAESVGQQVIVDNRPGGNTILATELAVRAAPDGHTVIMQTNNLAVNPTLYPKLPYDTLHDLVPVTLVAGNPHLLVVHPSVPADDLRQFVALAKSRPKALNFASAGSGTVNHLCAELFKMLAGIDMTHVPYKGSGSVMPDLLGGHVDLLFAALPTVSQHIRSGRLRALALTTTRRFRTLPDLPTIAELGYPGYEMSSWFGLLAPVNTPQDAVERLSAEFVKAVKRPDVQERLTDYEIFASSPREFGELLRSEIARNAKIVRAANVKID